MDALLLLLLDTRAPAGAHNHSGGMEPAVGVGLVRDLAGAEAFCAARLRTSGRVAAAFAAAAHRLASSPASHPVWSISEPENRPHGVGSWAELDAELDARTPSPALRAASRQLGRGLTRLVRATVPGFVPPPTTHHPLVLGAAVAAAGGDAELAARAAALGTISTAMSGAVRLLGLDPFAAQAALARLAPEVDAVARTAAATDDLAADALPALDLLADYHLTTEVRLFAS